MSGTETAVRVGGKAEPLFHIALIEPEIPGNAGNVGRLCLNVGARLHLVHPLGFQTDEKAVRRAGLDYWKHVDCVEHESLAVFDVWVSGQSGKLYVLSSHAAQTYTSAEFRAGDILAFGKESVGLAPEWAARHHGLRIPMVGPTRSLNVANAASVVAYEALHQIRPDLFG